MMGLEDICDDQADGNMARPAACYCRMRLLCKLSLCGGGGKCSRTDSALLQDEPLVQVKLVWREDVYGEFARAY